MATRLNTMEVTMADTRGGTGHAAHRGNVTGWLSEVFEINHAGVNWPRGVMFLDVVLVPLIVFWAIGHEQYLLSAIFGVLFTLGADPGGSFGYRSSHNAVFGVMGAGVTALAFFVGGTGWGWLVLAIFAITLAAGLTIKFGLHRYVGAMLLNIWFIIAIAFAFSLHHHTGVTNHTWTQVVAWVGGSALWIALTFVEWLVRGRGDRPQPFSEIPGDASSRSLTRPVVAYAVIRAVAIAGSAAIAFGLDLSHGSWLPIATIVATKPNLGQTTLAAIQRIVGALIGAAAAILFLLIPANEHGLRLFTISRGLEVVAIVLLMHAIGIRFANYALYYGAITAGVLIILDLPQPSNYSAEGYRVLWTLCGVAIGVLVMLLAVLLAKRSAKAPLQPGSRPTSQAASQLV
jgi:hypothetical protein